MLLNLVAIPAQKNLTMCRDVHFKRTHAAGGVITLLLSFVEPLPRAQGAERDSLSFDKDTLGPVRLNGDPDISNVRSALSVVRVTAGR